MKEATRAPAYAVIYHGLCDVVRPLGYALAIHGSLVSDLDLIAVPWIDDAVEPEAVMRATVRYCGKVGINLDVNAIENQLPELKPHGRLAWKLHMAHGGAVDLSVLQPRKDK